GESTGQPGQRFRVPSGPRVWVGTMPVVEVSSDEGWLAWEVVEDFVDRGRHDRAVIGDRAAGGRGFAPRVQSADGSVRAHGAPPPQGASVRSRGHAAGRGRRGNVPARAIRTLKSSIPFVRAVTNRHAAVGGVDAETVDEARVRGPLMLRTRGRAVTA